jgi:TRAP-type C4-dicarboxylate transport system permease small subunit
MRRLLDTLYTAAAYLAALFLIGTLAMVLLGICGRLFAFQVRGTDAYAGYFMAGSGFLALAHTLARGEHIRVNLILEHAGGRVRRALECWSLGAASALSIGFAYFSIRLFAIAFVDQFVRELSGTRPHVTPDQEPAHVE